MERLTERESNTMDFTSVAPYLDPFINWHQQQNHHQSGSSNIENMQLQPSSPQSSVGVTSTDSIRPPSSMTDRARLAKLPHPETALKCPRCESTNTKFCYFNNGSLSQPRHFCKTCRRYWTRGGALRSVPVGGGCRRNKKCKVSSSKSAATSDRPKGSASSTTTVPSSSFRSDAISHMQPQLPQFPLMNTLHHLTDYGGGDFGAVQPSVAPTCSVSVGDISLQIGSGGAGGIGNGDMEQQQRWRLRQFQLLAGLDPQTGLYAFGGEGAEPFMGGGQLLHGGKPSASVITQLSSVKMEEDQGFNLSRHLSGRNDVYSGNAWTDLSDFTSSSANIN